MFMGGGRWWGINVSLNVPTPLSRHLDFTMNVKIGAGGGGQL